MKVKRTISFILYVIAAMSVLLASGIHQVADWWNIAKPFFAVFFICIAIGLTITHFDIIRRYTYPVFVCMCAWAFKHKVLMTKFTRNTYRLYNWKNQSYSALFSYVQDLFDLLYIAEDT